MRMIDLQSLYIYLLPLLLSMSYFSISLSNSRSKGALKPGTPLKASVAFSVVAVGLFLAGYFSAGVLERRAEGGSEWVVFAMMMLMGFRMLIHAWKKKADEKVYDINDMPVVAAMALALGINMLFAGVAIRFMALPMFGLLGLIALMVLLFSFSGLMFGSQFREGFGRAMEFISGVGLMAIGIAFYVASLG